MVSFGAAGRGLRVSSRRSLSLAAAGIALVASVAACSSAPDRSTAPAAEDSPIVSNPSVVAATIPAEARDLEQVGGLELQVASYDVPDVLDAEGGAELGAMLDSLGLQPTDVGLVIAVDPDGSLAIGRWELPDRDAGAILSAWGGAAAGDWDSETLAGQPALSGRGADGSLAWATARDGIFLYIVTDDRDLAEAAAGSL
jgi:hypothetical protein